MSNGKEEKMDWVRDNQKEITTEFIDCLRDYSEKEIELVKNWVTDEDLAEWVSATSSLGKTKGKFIHGLVSRNKYCLELFDIIFDYDKMYDWYDEDGLLDDLDFSECTEYAEQWHSST